MKLVLSLIAISFLNLFACDLSTSEPVVMHPLLSECGDSPPADEPVEITIKFDPTNSNPELYHLYKYLVACGAISEVRHSNPKIVAETWEQIKTPNDDYSFLYPRKSEEKPFRLLSLDGGGTRGFMTCLFLSHLTHITQKPVHELFDMIVATSTGALIAAGLGTKKPKGSLVEIPKNDLLHYKTSIPSDYYSPEELAGIYLTDGPTIFSGKGWLGSWGGPKFSDEGIKTVLEKYFGNTTLTDLAIPVILTTYDLHARTLSSFTSIPGESSEDNLLVKDALRACVAAQTVFAPVMVEKHILSDAGVVKNNPSSLGLAMAAKHFKRPPTQVALLSLGCGHCVDPRPLIEYQKMGVTSWAPYLLSSVFDGQVDHEIVLELHRNGLGPSRYLRLSPLLEVKNMETDVVTLDHFKALSESTFKEIIRRRRDFLGMARRLTDDPLSDVLPSQEKDKPKISSLSVPLVITAESMPILPNVEHPLIQQSESLPSLSDAGLLQSPQTGSVVSDVGSIPLVPAPDQPMT